LRAQLQEEYAENARLGGRYRDGILEVTVPIVALQAQPRVIPVVRGVT
jgi:hypothetical protein